MNTHKTKTGSVGAAIAIVVALVLIVVVAYLGVTYGSIAAIGDAIVGANYQPSDEMADIIARDKFTKAGERILRATRPELEQASSFNQHCYSGAERESSVLGCYSNDRIYVYDVDNAELNGIKETVLAHELLHAVWNRMSSREKESLYADLDSTYKTHASEFSEHMSQYTEMEYYDELHSIIGSQLSSTEITANLSKHYAKYLENQDVVAQFYDAYNTKFEALEQKANTLSAQIESNKARIESLTTQYNATYDSLVADVDNFNARAGRPNGFSSRSQFEAERSQLIARQNSLDAMYNNLSTLINDTNALVEEYNNNVIQIGDLYDSVNSRVEKPNSMIEE